MKEPIDPLDIDMVCRGDAEAIVNKINEVIRRLNKLTEEPKELTREERTAQLALLKARRHNTTKRRIENENQRNPIRN